MKKFLLGLSLVLLISLWWGGNVAAEVRSGANPRVDVDQVVNDDLFAAGETIEIKGTVNGDVFAAGKQVRVSGQINGDIYVAAQTVEISGRVRDDLHVAAQDLRLDGANIGDGVMVAAESANFNEKSRLGGGLLFATGTLIGNAPIGRGAVGAGKQVTINNQVGREVRVDAGQLNVGERAEVTGDVAYRSGNDAVISDEANIKGELRRSYRRDGDTMVAAWLVRFTGGFLIWSYLSALVAGLVLLWLMRRPVVAVADAITNRLRKVAVTGLLTLLLVMPLMVVLLLTLVGIPLALLLMGTFVTTLYLSKLFVGVALGRWLLRRFSKEANPNLYVGFVLGLSLLYVLKIVPVLNLITALAVTIMGAGAVVNALYQSLYVKVPAAKPAPAKAARKK